MTKTISRRVFLSEASLMGGAIFTSQLCGLPLASSQNRFSGDDPDEAHRLLRNGLDLDKVDNTQVDPHLYDTIIVGGGLSGLTVAFRLGNRDILLLERQKTLGGVAQSGSWRGVNYCIGSSYMAKPQEGSDIHRLLCDIGICNRGRIVSDKNRVVLAPDTLLRSVLTPPNSAFFRSILKNRYPDVPPKDRELLALDFVTFKRFLADHTLQERFFGTNVGNLSSDAMEYIEYYCWGAFAASMEEISAYQALNFFVAEFDDILAFPGGNGFIAGSLSRRINEKKPNALRTGFYVLRVTRGGQSDGFVVKAYRTGTLHTFRSRTVVFSSPLFLAKRILPFLSADQVDAIESLEHRSYVVANVLLQLPLTKVLHDPMFRDVYALSRVSNVDIARRTTQELWKQTVCSDAEIAEWAGRGQPNSSVLTFYCPLPYNQGNAVLEAYSFDDFKNQVLGEVSTLLGPYGLKPKHIVDVRLTRWGHAMVVAKPGHLAGDLLARASKYDRGLAFAHTDVFGAPAAENAFQAAFRATEEITAALNS